MRRALLLALAGLGLGAACGKEPPPVDPRPSPTATIRADVARGGAAVLDMEFRTVQLPAGVRRVVALSPSALEYAASFDVEVVGRVSDAVHSAVPASVPTVGTTNAPKFAAVAELKPDLVIADAGLQGALRKDFDQFPYAVFLIKVASYESVIHAFRAVGEAVGQAQRAEELVASVEAGVAAAKRTVEGKPQPRVLLLTGTGRDVYAGSDASYAGSLLRILGATNVMGGAPQGAPIAGFGLVEVEQAATTNPDVVLVIAGPQSDLRAQLEGSPAWRAAPAGRDGRIVGLDPSLFLRSPGPRILEALNELVRVIYR